MMNKVQETLYLALLEKGELDTPETERAFYLACDCVESIAGISESSEEAGKVFDVLAGIDREAKRRAFEVGLRAGLKLSE
ncbi:MAG: hypothetical protein NC489_14735 [Ruminococcus flavefaciens]|nr:hypothetical protein [Ruminococcus flavefaciens]